MTNRLFYDTLPSMKRSATAISLLAAILCVVAGFVLAAQSSDEAKPINTVQTTVEPMTVDSLLEAVNQERTTKGIAPLVLDQRLVQSAQIKADDMTKNNYYDHVDKNGRHGYDIAHEYAPDVCLEPSENLQRDDNNLGLTSIESIASWKSSKPHYEAMMNPKYTITGFGISGIYIVEHFC